VRSASISHLQAPSAPHRSAAVAGSLRSHRHECPRARRRPVPGAVRCQRAEKRASCRRAPAPCECAARNSRRTAVAHRGTIGGLAADAPRHRPSTTSLRIGPGPISRVRAAKQPRRPLFALRELVASEVLAQLVERTNCSVLGVGGVSQLRGLRFGDADANRLSTRHIFTFESPERLEPGATVARPFCSSPRRARTALTAATPRTPSASAAPAVGGSAERRSR
jgi:hypothetical protein